MLELWIVSTVEIRYFFNLQIRQKKVSFIPCYTGQNVAQKASPDGEVEAAIKKTPPFASLLKP